MIKVKVEYMNGKISIYDVEYPKAYIAKIIESENDLLEDQKSVMAIYASDKLIAKFKNGFLNELVLEQSKTRILDDRMPNIKDKIKADEDWNEYQTNINAVDKSNWVTDHTGGDIKINYSPKSL
jgi:hypothetical protein